MSVISAKKCLTILRDKIILSVDSILYMPSEKIHFLVDFQIKMELFITYDLGLLPGGVEVTKGIKHT
jgi:hypothetical protein